MNQRKDDHVKHALEQHNPERVNDFDQMRLIHHSLAAIDVKDTSIRSRIGSINLEVPFYINAMTGGTDFTRDVNDKLSQVAVRSGLAMAVGSMSAAFKDPSSWSSFTVVRENNPEGIVFANLNPNYTAKQAVEAVERLQANALQIHINTAQEAVMPEGDRHFSHWKQNIRDIVAVLEPSGINVIVKEVGFGMSRETIKELMTLGVRQIDISGRGGTNFARIENDRRSLHKLDYLNDWGQSTITSLLEASAYRDAVELIASGGIRHPLDMVKAFTLGAKAAGLSAVILHNVMTHGVDYTVDMILQWKEDLHLLLSLLGAKTIGELRGMDYILSAELLNYCQNRGIKPREPSQS